MFCLDHVSVPRFDSGAMENWGLILYREEYLSYSPSYTDAREKEFIVAIVAHELAHMVSNNDRSFITIFSSISNIVIALRIHHIDKNCKISHTSAKLIRDAKEIF